MKIVSFSVAKAIKEAGYPQEYGEGSMYYSEDGKQFEYDSELYPMFPEVFCVCPYAMEVWLWLWRERNFSIRIDKGYLSLKVYAIFVKNGKCYQFEGNNPEETIDKTIEYLVENDLIK